MPLVITIEGGVAIPGIRCDFCGDPITEAADGNYVWEHHPDGTLKDGSVYFTHKRCCHAFEQRQSPAGRWGAIDLPWLLVFLKNGLRVDMPRTEALIRLLNR
jgi:hypothetical protein